MQSSDLKFFTNSEHDSLYQRFNSVVKHAKYFDILVGYFRTSGFNRIYKELENVDTIRILVGINTDKKTYDLYQHSRQNELAFESHKNCRDNFVKHLIEEIEITEETKETEISAKKFVELLKDKKLQIKAHPSQNIHAKVYITRFYEDAIDYGRVITGSSNFSENGLIAQREFNVELKDKVDVEFALNNFEKLWSEGVDIGDEYIDTIQNKTWLNDKITPYDIYIKFLYEYFKEDINAEEDLEFTLPDDFMDLAYQKQAVLSARKILDIYGGVFLSDVVGLGKTFITALLLQKLPAGRKLIICPPVLANYWKETLHQFYVPGFDVESLGKLDTIIKNGTERYKYVIIDEAHRFRNEMTQSYGSLHKICRNKKVVLISATPLNNKLDDLKNQIKLFQLSKNSIIPGIKNLDKFFKDLQKELDQFDKGTPEYIEAVKDTSKKVRDRVLKHIMVRRTRSEIKKYFSSDLQKQGLKFPEMAEPQRIIYEFDGETEKAFNRTIELLQDFSYARYTPLLFLKKQLSEFEQQSQRNVGGFMKGLLVKRLESSFYAFKKSLSRFILSYERFIKMLNDGTVWISNKVDVFDLLDNDNEERLESLLGDDEAEKYASDNFQPQFKEKLYFDLSLLKEIEELWENIDSDPKINGFIKELQENPLLNKKKILIFSESKETVEYLQEKIEKHYPDQTLSYSSQGGKFKNSPHKGDFLKDIILENYQPSHKDQKDNVKILITTDVLAEGINLHRSNVIINYDLPWNPTRVLQRVGRINRVGTKHDKVFVFNIFPTTHSDEHLGLENNIKSKIQAFHNVLGEDAKYLSDDEEVSTHELFGDKLYNKLNNKSTFDDDSLDEDSELKYLNIIRDIRDNKSDLFVKVKSLPKKSRSARKQPISLTEKSDRLLTFFRKGRLKKFVLSDDITSSEYTFLEAAKLFECDKDTPIQQMSDNFYDLLEKNKDFLEEITDFDKIDMEPHQGRGSSNEAHLIKMLKSVIGKFSGYTDDDDQYLRQVKSALEQGAIPKYVCKKIKDSLKRNNITPLNILNEFRKNISLSDLYEEDKPTQEMTTREVILSELMIGDK